MNIPATVLNWLHKIFNTPYRLHVRDYGGNGTPVIFLHGIAASSSSWDNLVSLIYPYFRCLTVDLLGFGESPKPQDHSYSLEEHAKCLHRTIKALNLKKPYILVGHSLGSLLAAHYTGAYSPELEKLYMLSPPIYVTDKPTPKIHIRLRAGAYGRAYAYFRNHKRFTMSGARQLKKILRYSSFVIEEETWIPFERSLEQCIEHQDVLADLKNIDTPTEIFYGGQDPLIIPSNIAALKELELIDVTKVRAGHMINPKYAQKVAGSLLGDEKFSRMN